MVCPKCYKEIEDASEFCQHCGNKIVKQVNKVETKFEDTEGGWIDSFESFSHLPAIITVINALIVFICSMVCCSVGPNNERAFGVGLLILFIGSIVCACLYFLIKIAIAPIVLQSKCLLQVVKKLEEKDKTKEKN